MKNFSAINIMRPKQPSESEKVHLAKLNRFAKGETVRGDDLVKAGLWLVAEVARSAATPYFQRERFRRFLERVNTLAVKQYHLELGWPGRSPDSAWCANQEQALDFFGGLIQSAPDREDCCD